MTVFKGKQTELLNNEPMIEGGIITRELLQWVSELVGRLNNAKVLEFAGNPETNIEGALNQLCRDTITNNVYIKTIDEGNTGWVLV